MMDAGVLSHGGGLPPRRFFPQRRPYAALQWDAVQNKVVAPRAQVGLSGSHLRSDPTATNSATRLLDGFDIPEEAMELSDLNDILSMETWETYLTDTERQYLAMYLPEGVDPLDTVEALLMGDNFHFGNPLQKWGEAVCAGEMHPDAILNREANLRLERKAYLKRLGNYHGNMVQNLQKMKEVWEDCENPEDFLSLIHRRLKPGQSSRENFVKSVHRAPKRIPENNVFLKKRLLEGPVAGNALEDHELHVPSRSKAKKAKTSKTAEEGSERLKMTLSDANVVKPKMKPVEEIPKKQKNKFPADVNDYPMGSLSIQKPKSKKGKISPPEDPMLNLKQRPPPEGGAKRSKSSSLVEEEAKKPKVRFPEEGMKRLKIKSLDEGTSRLDFGFSEKESKRLQNRPLDGPRIKFTDGGAKRQQQVKSFDNDYKSPEIKPTDEKEEKARSSDKGTKKLKIKPSRDGTAGLDFKAPLEGMQRPEILSSEDGIGRLHFKITNHDMPSRSRSKSKRPKDVSLDEGVRSLDDKRAEQAPKKLHIKVSESGRNTIQVKPPEEEAVTASRLNARRRKGNRLEEELPKRSAVKTPEEGVKRLKIKPSEDGATISRRAAPEEISKPSKDKLSRPGGKRTAVRPSGGHPQKLKSPEVEDFEPRDFDSNRPLEKKRKGKEPDLQQVTKKQRTKLVEKLPEEVDFDNSNFEREWFRKYVQVVVAPVSGPKLSKATQSVQVSARMYKDVKRRFDSGEVVHLDSLEPEKEQPKSKPVPKKKKAAGPTSREIEAHASLWQTIVHDLPAAHATFVERRDTLQNLAVVLAHNCKQVWGEDDPYEPVQDYGSPSGFANSSPQGDGTQSGGQVWPSGGDPSPSVSDASAGAEEEGFPGRTEDSRSAGRAYLSGGEASPSGEEAYHSGGEEEVVSVASPVTGDASQSAGEEWEGGGGEEDFSVERAEDSYSDRRENSSWGKAEKTIDEDSFEGEGISDGIDRSPGLGEEFDRSHEIPASADGSPNGSEGSPDGGEVSPGGGKGSPGRGEEPSSGGKPPSGDEGSPRVDGTPNGGGDSWASEDDGVPKTDPGAFTDEDVFMRSGDDGTSSGDEVSQGAEGEGSPSEADLEEESAAVDSKVPTSTEDDGSPLLRL